MSRAKLYWCPGLACWTRAICICSSLPPLLCATPCRYIPPPCPACSWERSYDAFLSALGRQQDKAEASGTDPGIGPLVTQELGKLQGTDQLGLRCAGGWVLWLWRQLRGV